MKARASGYAVLMFSIAAANASAADMGTAFTYQGYLQNLAGTPVNGTCSFRFGLWDAFEGGALVTVEAPATNPTVVSSEVESGIFTATMDFGANAINGQARWLEIEVMCGAICEGGPTPGQTCVNNAQCGSGGICVPEPYTLFPVRKQLTPAPHALALPGLYTQQNVESPNIIGGSSSNSVALGVVGATISGGANSFFPHVITDSYGTIGGGNVNTVGDGNEISNDSGGATVGGGTSNAARAYHATIGGGLSNTASGVVSTVSGGDSSTASGFGSSVGGGQFNTSIGGFSTVPGGQSNTAAGHYSFAAGQRAQANDTGSFVWSDSTTPFPDVFSSTASNQFLIKASGGVGINTNAPIQALDVSGNIHASGTIESGSSITIDGTARTITSDESLELRVADGRALRIQTNANSPIMIGGYSGNSAPVASSGATIAGGGESGVPNSVTSAFGTVSGGRGNSAGAYATVAGGTGNMASGLRSTVGGGLGNIASAEDATVNGGRFNTASGIFSSVAGGVGNKATGMFSAVGGGNTNYAGPLCDGGSNDGLPCTLDSDCPDGGSCPDNVPATVGGGVGNVATAYSSTVGGGAANEASGSYSTVPGGAGNHAGGDSSFAAGNGALVRDAAAAGEDPAACALTGTCGDEGTFVWADNSTTSDFTSTGPNQFLIRAAGGVGIGTNSPTAQLDVLSSSMHGIQGTTSSNDGVRGTATGGTGSGVAGFATAATVFAAGYFSNTAGGRGLFVGGASEFVRSGASVASFDRGSNDGAVIEIRQAGTTEGTISVSGTTVSYNGFTGSHYGWTDQVIERGMLVVMTGENRRRRADDDSAEPTYGIAKSSHGNDPRCLGAYLGLLEPANSSSIDNPHQVMAVGNGDMWVTDSGKDIAPGDHLISSDVAGHAMLDDPQRFPIGHVIARAGEPVTWSKVSDMAGGRKHKRISVFFESFERGLTLDSSKILEHDCEISNLKSQIAELKAMVDTLTGKNGGAQ